MLCCTLNVSSYNTLVPFGTSQKPDIKGQWQCVIVYIIKDLLFLPPKSFPSFPGDLLTFKTPVESLSGSSSFLTHTLQLSGLTDRAVFSLCSPPRIPSLHQSHQPQ